MNNVALFDDGVAPIIARLQRKRTPHSRFEGRMVLEDDNCK